MFLRFPLIPKPQISQNVALNVVAPSTSIIHLYDKDGSQGRYLLHLQHIIVIFLGKII